MNILLKKSQPSEVSKAVPLIYSSGPDAFEYVFKNKQLGAKDFLHHAFVRKGGEFSYDNHYSLYWNGEMVGIGSIFDGKKAANFVQYEVLNILRCYGLKSFGVIRRGLKTEGIIKPPNKKETVLAHLAIRPELRGKGLGRNLIHELIKKADVPSDHGIILDVSEENPRAKALYERLGFVVIEKNISSLKNQFSYVPNHFRMELKNQ